jgi:hypothetical protein
MKYGKKEIWTVGTAVAGLMVLMLIATISTEPQSPSGETPVQTFAGTEETTPVVVVEKDPILVAQEQWTSLLPLLKELRGIRQKAVTQLRDCIDGEIRKAVTEIDATAFADAVCGWESTGKMIEGDFEHRQWVLGKLRELVFNDLKWSAWLRSELAALNVRLSEMDAQVLTSLQADVTLASDSLVVPEIDLSSMDNAFWPVVNDSQSYVLQAWGEFAGGTLVGGKLGMLTGGGVLAMGPRDDDGNPTPGTVITAFFTGLVAELVGELIVEEVVDTRGRLATEVSDRVRAELMRFQSDFSLSSCWKTPLQQIDSAHESAIHDALISLLKVDRDWAIAAFENSLTTSAGVAP